MNMRSSIASGVIAVGLAASFSPLHAQDVGEHRVCHNVRIEDRPSDNHQIAGTAVGAVAGGLLGHTIGGGKGKVLTTVGGAVAGGYAGKKVQENHQENHATYHYERRCHMERG